MTARAGSRARPASSLSGIMKNPILKPVLIGAAVVIVLFLIVSAATHKPQGNPMFGICKAFVELNVQYPPTLQYTQVEQYQRAVRLYYTHTTPYGGQKSETIECAFEKLDNKWQLTTILLNRDPIDTAKVKVFNQTLSAVLAAESDLTLPRPLDGSLKSLKREGYN